MPLHFFHKIKHSGPSEVPVQNQKIAAPSVSNHIKPNNIPYSRSTDSKHRDSLPVRTQPSLLQDSKEIPKIPASGRKTAYEEVRDQIFKGRRDDMMAIERNKARSPEELFMWLQEANKNHLAEDKFRAGFDKVKPYMSGLMRVADFGSQFTAFDSSGFAALGVGLFKSALGVTISLCEASENLDEKIQNLISNITIVNRLNLLDSQVHLEMIHAPLVRVYRSLFEFFFKVFDLLHQGHFMRQVFSDSGEISSLITKFSDSCQLLYHAVETETLVVQTESFIGKGSAEDRLICKFLGEGKQAEKGFENVMNLKSRAKGSCDWIHGSREFRRWLQDGKDNFLALFGDMGSGKTTIAAYVIETLESQRPKDEEQQPIVCSFYCRDDHFRNKPENIWSSLLSQIVRGRPDLQSILVGKWKDPKTDVITAPEKQDIASLFVQLVQMSQAPVYMVLDALDECPREALHGMSAVFKDLSGLSSFRAFLTSRHDDKIRNELPEGSITMTHKSTPKEDRVIAQHHVNVKLSVNSLRPGHREEIVEKIARKADGSAIWIQMMVAYLAANGSGYLQSDLEIIDKFPLPLAKAYATTYESLSEKHGERGLKAVLQVLAMAYRPLTMQELAAAVNLMAKENLEGVNILLLARPFIQVERPEMPIVDPKKDLDPFVVRLAHQSLKELVMMQPPVEWGQKRVRSWSLSQQDHVSGLNEKLALACIDHLKQPDYEVDLFDPSNKATTVTGEFPPFFNYAASFWARHFADADGGYNAVSASLVEAAASICKQSSACIRNWTQMFMSTSRLSFPSDPDHIVIASYFNHPSVVSSLLKKKKDEIKKYQLAQALYWGALRASTSCVKAILIRDRFIRVADSMVNGESPLHAAAKSEDLHCLVALIKSGLFAIDEKDRRNRTALSLAAQHGNAAAVDVLISNGAEINIRDPSNRTPLYWAVYARKNDAADVLLSQPYIDLRPVAGEFGNVFTLAAAHNNSELIKRFTRVSPVLCDERCALSPQDFMVPDAMWTSPLMHAIQNKNYYLTDYLIAIAMLPALPVFEQSDRMGMTALAWAARSPDPRFLQRLTQARDAGLECGRVVHTGDNNNRTPLFYAIEAGDAAELNARTLVEVWGADVNHRNAAGSTPLLCAWRSLSVFKYLWETKGVDRHARDNDGRSVLDLANDAKIRTEYPMVVDFLAKQSRRR